MGSITSGLIDSTVRIAARVRRTIRCEPGKRKFQQPGVACIVALLWLLLWFMTASSFAQTLLRVIDDPIPQGGAFFGLRIVGVGDVNGDGVPDFAVGAPNQNQVFIISGATGATLLTLSDPTPQADASFGVGLAAIGDVDGDGVPDLAVGASAQTVGINVNQGQVFIFSGATGALLRTLDNPTPQGHSIFGFRLVAIGDVDGDGVSELAVGAAGQDAGGNFQQGRAFIFSGRTGNLIRILDDPTPQTNAQFGIAVAVSADVDGDGIPDLAVGAPGQNGFQGQVFIFSGRTGAVLRTLNDPAPQGVGSFGISLANVGDINLDRIPDLAVGASGKTIGTNARQGQAFVFSGHNGALLRTMNDPVPQAQALFGLSLAGGADLDGDGVLDIFVGAPAETVQGNAVQGQVFVFSGRTGALIRTLNDPNAQANARFGNSIAILGDVLNGDGFVDFAIGAPGLDSGAGAPPGQVFIFSGAPGGALRKLNAQGTGTAFGISVASVPDLDGDGMPELAVGQDSEVSQQGQGQVLIFSPVTGTLLRTLTNPTPQTDDRFGRSLCTIQDVDGDGVADLAVGAIGVTVGGNEQQGQVFLFSGKTGALLRVLNDPTPGKWSFFGEVLADAGDVDGDGVHDLMVGVPYQTNADLPIDQGQAFVFSGRTGALLRVLNDPTPQFNAHFGQSLGAIGDVDGDGVPDLAVGAHGQSVGNNPAQGQVFVFSGKTGALLRILNDPLPEARASFGIAVANVGDVDGDRAPDVAVGAVGTDIRSAQPQWRVFIFSGKTGALLRTLSDPSPDASYFFSSMAITSVADVDGDSVPDFVVSTPFATIGGNVQGRAWVFSGRTGVLLRILDDPTRQALAYFGYPGSIAGIGDVNGDDVPDVAIGAFGQNVGGITARGQVFLLSLTAHPITVQPTDSTTGGTPVTITFDAVAGSGTTNLTTSTTGPQVPSGFKLGNPATYFDITTSTSPVGLIEICIKYSGLITFSSEPALQLFHFEDTNGDGTPDTWVNRTTSLDLNNHVICGTVSALSPFTIFESDMRPVGLQPPLLPLVTAGDPVTLPANAFKLGSVFPLKLQLVSGNGTPLTNADVSAPQIVALVRSGQPLTLQDFNLDAGRTSGGSLLFQFSSGTWTYNLSTRQLSAGTYIVTLQTPDGKRFSAGFVLK